MSFFYVIKFVSRVGKLKYDNGEFYEGEWMRGNSRIKCDIKVTVWEGKRHGKGVYVYLDGMQASAIV